MDKQKNGTHLSRNYFPKIESRSLYTDYNQKYTKLLIIHAMLLLGIYIVLGERLPAFIRFSKKSMAHTHKKDKYCPSQKHKKQKQMGYEATTHEKKV